MSSTQIADFLKNFDFWQIKGRLKKAASRQDVPIKGMLLRFSAEAQQHTSD